MVLEGRIALVTGGGRGLGRATALALAERGARVVVTARTLAEVEETALQIRQQFGVGRSMAIKADVTREREVLDAFDSIRRRWGGVDILVNNAGGMGATRPIASMSLSDWQKTVDLNLTSAFLCTREALRDMARSRRGRIINVSSESAEAVVPGIAPYSVAKAGVEHLTRLTAAEGQAIGVVAIAFRPGVIDTQMQADLRTRTNETIPPELRAVFSAYKHKGMLVPPELPARMIAYLCVAQAGEINGRVLDASEMEELLTK